MFQTSTASPTYNAVSSERYRYDAAGNQTAVVRPGGGQYLYTYTSRGQLASTSQPLTAGPVAWWRLNETAGSAAADSSGSGYSATYSGVTLNRPAAPSGGTGNTAAAGFSPASGSKVILDDPSLDITDDLTVQAWVNSTDNGNWQMVVTRMNYDGAWRIGYEFRLTPDGRLSFEQSTSAGEVRSVESVGAITRGTWTKVIAAWHRCRHTNGPTEPINNLVKRVKRVSVNRPSIARSMVVRVGWVGAGQTLGAGRGWRP